MLEEGRSLWGDEDSCWLLLTLGLVEEVLLVYGVLVYLDGGLWMICRDGESGKKECFSVYGIIYVEFSLVLFIPMRSAACRPSSSTPGPECAP